MSVLGSLVASMSGEVVLPRRSASLKGTSGLDQTPSRAVEEAPLSPTGGSLGSTRTVVVPQLQGHLPLLALTTVLISTSFSIAGIVICWLRPALGGGASISGINRNASHYSVEFTVILIGHVAISRSGR